MTKMACSEYSAQLRPWLRGELSSDAAAAVERHVAGCYTCATVVENESAILETLRARHAIPAASSGFDQRVLAAAGRRSSVRGGSRLLGWPIVGGSVAAALALGIALGLGMNNDAPQMTADSETGTDRVVAEAPYNVKLAFDSATAMDNVTLTVELPAHVEMSSYPGYRRLSWNVDLDEGENVLNLPLNVLFPGEGELVAHLDNGERRKTFRAPLSKIDDQTSSEPVL